MEVKHYSKNRDDRNNLEIKTSKQKSPGRLGWFKSALGVLVLALVVIVLFVAAWVNFMQRPLSSDKADFKYFEIKSGDSTIDIGSRLTSEGIIRSKWAFYFAVKLDPGILQAGHYKLSASMNLGEIINKIHKGEVDAFAVTVPEGYRTLQIAKLLQEKGEVDPQKFIEAATGKEGSLFPDTYLFPKSYDPSKIVREMQDNFEKRTKSLGLSDEQLVIASIVEREAISDDERSKIAAVYFNRLNDNMMLQADPTIRYGLDSQKYLKDKSVDFDFWQPITKADIASLNNNYNTYKIKGLPPAPICNPGLKSIEAAVKPEANFSDYYYFFHDKDKKIHFSKNYQEHLKLIQQNSLAE